MASIQRQTAQDEDPWLEGFSRPEVADFIHDLLIGAEDMARYKDLNTLAVLISAAAIEAGSLSCADPRWITAPPT